MLGRRIKILGSHERGRCGKKTEPEVAISENLCFQVEGQHSHNTTRRVREKSCRGPVLRCVCQGETKMTLCACTFGQRVVKSCNAKHDLSSSFLRLHPSIKPIGGFYTTPHNDLRVSPSGGASMAMPNSSESTMSRSLECPSSA